MAKTKPERIAGIEEQIQLLENQKKRLIQEQKAQERKERTKRLSFLEKTLLTDFARRTLDTIAAQDTAAVAPRPAEIARESGGEREQDGGNGARVTG